MNKKSIIYKKKLENWKNKSNIYKIHTIDKLTFINLYNKNVKNLQKNNSNI